MEKAAVSQVKCTDVQVTPSHDDYSSPVLLRLQKGDLVALVAAAPQTALIHIRAKNAIAAPSILL